MIINPNNIKVVLFDFDGTIADTLTLGLEVFNERAKAHGYQTIASREELEYYRNMNARKIIEALGISFIKLPLIVSDLRKRLGKKIQRAEPFQDIVPVIKELSKSHKLGIVTSNSRRNIDVFLSKYDLDGEFIYFSTGIRLFGKSNRLKRLLASKELRPEEVVMIGDETRDVEGARKCGIPIISVSWGFQAREALQQMSPDFLIDHPKELLDILSG